MIRLAYPAAGSYEERVDREAETLLNWDLREPLYAFG